MVNQHHALIFSERKGETIIVVLLKEFLFIITWLRFVRLNLFNHFLALFRVKFACNLAIRYPIFRCDLFKGSVWESVKKSQKCTIQGSLTTRSRGWQVARMAHIWSMQGELKGHANYGIIGQNFQSGQVVSSRLKLATRSSHELELPKCLVWL